MTTLQKINKNTYRLKTQRGRTQWIIGWATTISYYKGRKFTYPIARQMSLTAITFPKELAGKRIELHVKVIKK